VSERERAVVRVRRANAGDRETLARLLTAQLVEHALPAEPERIARGLDVALGSGSPSWLLVAERDGEAVGVLLANRGASVEKGGAALWIEELYVVPAARRSGVANALLEHLADAGRAAGIAALDLEVVPSQSAALALYALNGFKKVDRLRFTRDL
jgi:ribosomal protein S18 acetylase RimI-like enzyme